MQIYVKDKIASYVGSTPLPSSQCIFSMSLFNKLFYKTKNTSTETHTVTVCPLNTQKHTRSTHKNAA